MDEIGRFIVFLLHVDFINKHYLSSSLPTMDG